jgi:hypothetical protein
MYACHSASLPGYVWTSTEDATGFLPGWVCEKLEQPLPGSSVSGWSTAYKIARLIEGLPF